MTACKTLVETPHKIRFPEFKPIEIEDRECFESFVEKFQPRSCEYNFANLFAWQDSCEISWTLYRDRLLVYDAESDNCFMPLGDALSSHEMMALSLELQSAGLSPDFILCSAGYLEDNPELREYYDVEERRDIAEYIYDVNSLARLTGEKLHKKKKI